MSHSKAATSKALPIVGCFTPMFDTEQFFEDDVGLFTIELGQISTGDQTLQDLAEQFQDEQRHVLGHIQLKADSLGRCNCREMHLVDLSSGTLTRISENLGSGARGCHLNWAALSEVAQSIEAALSFAPDILIVNRFGRAEAEGKGMRTAIEKALNLGIPVIVGVRPEYVEVWQDFHGGLAKTVSIGRDACTQSPIEP